MSKYYDLDKLKDMIEAKAETLIGDGAIAFHAVAKWLDFLPAADVAPVVHAHWIYKFQYANHDHCYICSACGMSERVPYRGYEKRFLHCHCGAKMDEGAEK